MGSGIIYSRNACIAELAQKGQWRGQPHPNVLLHKLAAAGLCELKTLRVCSGKQDKCCFWGLTTACTSKEGIGNLQTLRSSHKTEMLLQL